MSKTKIIHYIKIQYSHHVSKQNKTTVQQTNGRTAMPQTQNTHPPFEICIDAKVETPPATNTFERAFLDAVDLVFDRLCGREAAQVFFRYLEDDCGISREMLPEKIPAFAAVVEAVFGRSAFLIEARIMCEMHGKFPGFMYSPRKSGMSFADYSDALKRYAGSC